MLVFVETKRNADALEDFLCRNDFAATSIHGAPFLLRVHCGTAGVHTPRARARTHGLVSFGIVGGR